MKQEINPKDIERRKNPKVLSAFGIFTYEVDSPSHRFAA